MTAGNDGLSRLQLEPRCTLVTLRYTRGVQHGINGSALAEPHPNCRWQLLLSAKRYMKFRTLIFKKGKYLKVD